MTHTVAVHAVHVLAVAAMVVYYTVTKAMVHSNGYCIPLFFGGKL